MQPNINFRLIRRAGRRFIQGVRYMRPGLKDMPILFANAFPKSGTHLLTQVLLGFTKISPAVDSGLPAIVTYEGKTGRERSEGEILRDLQRLLPGDIAYGHLHARPCVIAAICRDSMLPFFLLRDPRDVAVSHVHYVTEMQANHILHEHYSQSLRSFNERLLTSITGIHNREGLKTESNGKKRSDHSLDKNAALLPDIYERFKPYLGWLSQPDVLTLRFEDFVERRSAVLNTILDHVLARGYPLSCDRNQAFRTLDGNINPEASPTFRSGRVGSWRDAFTEEHKKIFKQIAGDLLIQLGYEQDDRW